MIGTLHQTTENTEYTEGVEEARFGFPCAPCVPWFYLDEPRKTRNTRKGLADVHCEKRCRSAFDTADQIRPWYEMAVGIIRMRVEGCGFTGVKLGLFLNKAILEHSG